MRRSYRRPHRIKRKKAIWQNRFFWLAILIFIILGGIFYLICFHSFFQIKEIKISGNQKISAEDLKNLLEAKLNQKVLFFPSKSIFLINFNKIKEEILKKIFQIEEVNLSKKFPDGLVLEIKERKPVATFCPTSKETKCFFVDKEGIVFEITEAKQDFFKLKKEIEREINLGEKIIGKEELSKILEVEAKLKKELKIFSEEILIVSEERLNLKTSEGWQIYFNFRENLNWQLTKLKAVLEREIPPERRKNLEYIDVRFGNFAPYKYHP